MVNSKQIGNVSVNRAREFYESEGYVTTVVELTGRFRKYKDAFSKYFEEVIGREGGFDILCIHPSKLPVLVQVTTSKPKVHIPYIAFAKEFGHTVVTEVYVRMKKRQKDYRIIYNSDGTKVKRMT